MSPLDSMVDTCTRLFSDADFLPARRLLRQREGGVRKFHRQGLLLRFPAQMKMCTAKASVGGYILLTKVGPIDSRQPHTPHLRVFRNRVELQTFAFRLASAIGTAYSTARIVGRHYLRSHLSSQRSGTNSKRQPSMTRLLSHERMLPAFILPPVKYSRGFQELHVTLMTKFPTSSMCEHGLHPRSRAIPACISTSSLDSSPHSSRTRRRTRHRERERA